MIQLYILGFLMLCLMTVLRISMLNYLILAAGARAVRESRARLVASTDQERQRIERDLHDGAQQHLVAAAMQLRVIQRLADDPIKPVGPLLTQASDGLHRAMVELRDLAHGIYPAQLTDHGLEAALRAAVLDCPLPVDIHARDLTRCPADIETNAYFACIEAIQNATKHAGPNATIRIDLDGRHGLSIDITDTGPGASLQTLRAGHGITNITDRIAAIGGTLTIHTQPHTSPHGARTQARPPRPASTSTPTYPRPVNDDGDRSWGSHSRHPLADRGSATVPRNHLTTPPGRGMTGSGRASHDRGRFVTV
jgi:signal transduction histidine kinase